MGVVQEIEIADASFERVPHYVVSEIECLDELVLRAALDGYAPDASRVEPGEEDVASVRGFTAHPAAATSHENRLSSYRRDLPDLLVFSGHFASGEVDPLPVTRPVGRELMAMGQGREASHSASVDGADE
jgi:hypothetical protein